MSFVIVHLRISDFRTACLVQDDEQLVDNTKVVPSAQPYFFDEHCGDNCRDNGLLGNDIAQAKPAILWFFVTKKVHEEGGSIELLLLLLLRASLADRSWKIPFTFNELPGWNLIFERELSQ
jgi:hypothetical protein